MVLHSVFLDILKQRDFGMFNKVGGNVDSEVNGEAATLLVYMDGKKYSLDELKTLEQYWKDFIETENFTIGEICINGGRP